VSNEHGEDPQARSGMGRRAFIQKMAVAGFAVPAIVTLADEGTALAGCKPTTTRPPRTTCPPKTTAPPKTTPPPTTTAAPTTTPAQTTTPAPPLTTTTTPAPPMTTTTVSA
jgi:hypothetical protein